VITRNNDVYSWGKNNKGQLGIGSTTDSRVPARVETLSDISKITSGSNQSFAVGADGTVYAWGDNTQPPYVTLNDPTSSTAQFSTKSIYTRSWTTTDPDEVTNQLGIANTSVKIQTTPVNVVKGNTINENFESVLLKHGMVATRGSHSVFFNAEDGTVWSWGIGSYGQMGDYTQNNRSYPVQTGSNDYIRPDVVDAVLTGFDGTVKSTYTTASPMPNIFTMREDDTLKINMDKVYRQIVPGFNLSFTVKESEPFHWTPDLHLTALDENLITVNDDGTITPVRGHFGETSVILRDDNSDIGYVFRIKVMPIIDDNFGLDKRIAIPKLAVGNTHTVALKSDGTVWTWGNNSSGQLGDRTKTNDNTPIQVVDPTGLRFLEDIVDVAAGDGFSMALTSTGQLYIWGADTNAYPTLAMSSVKNIAASGSYKFVITDGGHVRAWSGGTVATGDVGRGESASTGSYFENAVSVTGGNGHITILRDDGTVWTWGDNTYGQLGNTGRKYLSMPGQVVVGESEYNSIYLRNVVEIASGSKHNVAVVKEKSTNPKSDATTFTNVNGKVYTWGLGTSGQLGNGNTNSSYRPVRAAIPDSEVISHVSAYGSDSLALVKDTSVYAWGNNSTSQAGANASSSTVATPVKVASNNSAWTNVYGAYSGTDFMASYLDNGTVWTWGNNSSGQLGNKTYAASAYPVQTIGEKPYDKLIIEEVVISKADGSTQTVTFPYEIVVAPDESFEITKVMYEEKLEFNIIRDRILTRVDLGDITSSSINDKVISMSGMTATAVGTSGTNTQIRLSKDNASAFLPVYVRNDGVIATPMASLTPDSGMALREDGTLWAWGNNDYNKINAAHLTATSFNYAVGVVKATEEIGTVLDNIRQIATGDDYTIALTTDGHVLAWGLGTSGQLGDGNTSNRVTPVKVKYHSEELSDIIAISTYSSHTAALSKDGFIYAWGNNSYGKKGENKTNENVFAIRVGKISDAAAIAVGENHTLALKKDGTVWAFGLGTSGQLGNGSKSNASIPVQVVSGDASSDDGFLHNIVAITAGANFSAALSADGNVYTWGAGANGQLGDGSASDSSAPVKAAIDIPVTQLSARCDQILAIAENGDVYVWGNGINTPEKVEGLANAINVAAGGTHAEVILSDGSAYGWGKNDTFQLGDGTYKDSAVPVQTNIAAEGLRVAHATAGSTTYTNDDTKLYEFTIEEDQTLVLDSVIKYDPYMFNVLGNKEWSETIGSVTLTALNPEVVSVSSNTITALRYGTSYIKLTDENSANVGFIKVNVKPAGAFTAPMVAAGNGFVLALKDDGSLYGWGSNEHGVLTLADSVESVSSVSRIRKSSSEYLTNVVKIAAGAKHALALTADGTLYAWGQNENGQLGTGNYTDSTYPKAVNINDVRDIAAGEAHSVAVTNSGRVYVWGSNDSGQIGFKIGDSANVVTPKLATDYGESKYLESIVGIAAGGHHTAAVSASGTVYTWGRNVNGQLGNGDNTRYDVPRELIIDKDSTFYQNIVKLSASDEHSMAVSADGDVYSWGYNYYGQLGDGTGIAKNVPVNVVTANNYNTSKLTGIVDIYTGPTHTLAISDEGNVYSWGDNYYGELGDATNAQKSTAVLVKMSDGSYADSVSGVAAGDEHSVLFLSDGEVYTFGKNDYGQLAKTGEAVNVATSVGDVAEENKGIIVGEIKVDTTPETVYNILPENITITTDRNVSVNLDKITLIDSISNFVLYNSASAGATTGTPVNPANVSVTSESTLVNVVNGVVSAATPTSYGTSQIIVKDNSSGYIKTFNVTYIPEKDNSIAMITGGEAFSIALKADGTVWTWGDNTYGQLGMGTYGDKSALEVPAKVEALSGIIKVAAGKEYAMALGADGTVYTWGNNRSGQLGIYKSGADISEEEHTPVKVDFDELNSDENIIDVSAGDNFAMALTSGGRVFVWGDNTYNQLLKAEAGNTNNSYHSPNLIDALNNITMISAGGTHLMAYGDKVYTWGNNSNGQLGTGTTTGSGSASVSTASIPSDAGVITQIMAKGAYSSVVAGGSIYAWGDNSRGQLGRGDSSNPSVPTKIKLDDVSEISGGRYHMVAVADNNVYAWGSNTKGQLGLDDSSVSFDEPQAVLAGESSSDEYMSNVWGIGAGDETTFAIAADGSVFAMGNNANSQLGALKTVDSVYKAVQVMITNNSGMDFGDINVSDGRTYTSATLRYDLSLDETETLTINPNSIHINAADSEFNIFASITSASVTAKAENLEFSSLNPSILTVGRNTGVVTPVSRGTTIVKVYDKETGVSGYIEISVKNDEDPYTNIGIFETRNTEIDSAGKYHISYIQLHKDGSVSTWGDNESGQLGTGDTKAPEEIPVELTIANIVQTATGENHMIALDSNGNLYGWGANFRKQLMVNTSSLKKPTQIGTKLTGIKQIVSGNDFIAVLLDDGTIRTAGSRDFGQLGIMPKKSYTRRDGTTTLDVSSLDIVQIAAGENSMAALSSDGSVYIWGKHNGGLDTDEPTESEITEYALVTKQSRGESVSSDEYIQDIVKIESVGDVIKAYKNDGTVWAWGDGELDGETIHSSTPVSVDEFESKELNVIYAEIIENGEVVKTFDLNSPFNSESNATISLTSNQKINIPVEKIYGTANLKFGQTYDSVNFELEPEVAKVEADSDIISTSIANSVITIAPSGANAGRSGITISDGVLNTAYSFNVVVTAGGVTELVTPMIVSGRNHTLALKRDGTVWAWGDNTSGQLGDGTNGTVNVDKMVPRQVRIAESSSNASVLSNIIQISAVENSSAAVDSAGNVYVWGDNTNNRLGLGSSVKSVNVPTKMDTKGIAINYIQIGENHSVARSRAGRVYTWGNNTYGQLGYRKSDKDETYNDNTFNTVSYLVDSNGIGRNLLSVAVGDTHTLGIITASGNTSGTVYAWGNNSSGQLGNTSVTKTTTPVAVKLANGSTIDNAIKVYAYDNYSMALTKDGNVYVWGDNTYGQLGTGSKGGTLKNAALLKGTTGDGALSNIKDIAVNATNAAAIDADGNVYVWGQNDRGQIGDASTYERLYPVKQSDMRDTSDISLGLDHTVAMTEDGRIYAWGANESGQLGNSSLKDEIIPYPVGANTRIVIQDARIIAKKTSDVALMTFSLMAVDPDVETKVTYTPDTNPIPSVIVLTDDEQFVIDKDKAYEEQRFYLNLEKNEMTVESKIEDIYTISSDTDMFTVDDDWVVTPTEKAKETGYASATLIIHDRTRNVAESLEIEYRASSLHNAPMVVSGDNHSVALMSDGTVWTWGANESGQLGNNSVNEVTMPVQVKKTETAGSYLNDAVQVAAGAKFSMALMSDGTVWAWGDNTSGQLGNSTAEAMSLLPQQIPTLENIVAISAGGNMAAALDSNGHVWVWGANDSGKLGAGSSETVLSTPQRVLAGRSLSTTAYIENVIQISVGSDHMAALTNDGNVYTWGKNTYGQLGEGTYGSTADKVVPVEADIHNVAKVYAGYNNTAAIKTDGSAWAWGDNASGQVGNNNNGKIVPIPVPVMYNETDQFTDVREISIGETSMTAIDLYDQDVWIWGKNLNAVAGNSKGLDGIYYRPTQVYNSQDDDTIFGDIIKLSSGKNFAVGLLETGRLRSIGVNNVGQLGDGTSYDREFPVNVGLDRNVRTIMIGNAHVEDADGNHTADYSKDNLIPYEINLKQSEKLVIDLDDLSLELEDGFNLITGKIIVTDFDSIDITSFDESIATVSGGIVTPNTDKKFGTTYITFKENETGARGLVKVNVMPEGNEQAYPQVAAGGNITVALTDAGEVYTWGDNTYGQLGVGNASDIMSHSTTPVKALENNVVKIAAGDDFVVVLMNNGTVWTWGKNDYGQLGLGANDEPNPNKNQLKPVQIKGITDIVDIAAGANHTLLLDKYGNVYGFGDYSEYQVSTETNTSADSSIPKILNLPATMNIYAVEASGNTSYALTRNGDIVVWGDDSNGKFGKANYSGNGPVYVNTSEDTQIVSFSAGGGSVLAIDSNGSVYGFGDNSHYQLAMGATTDVVAEPQLSKFTVEGKKAVQVDAGLASLVRYTDDTVRVSGANEKGQLGIGVTGELTSGEGAVLHAGATNPEASDAELVNAKMVAVSSDGSHAILYNNKGVMYTWGDNSRGQLGDGTIDERYEPVLVLVDGGGAYIDFSRATLTRTDKYDITLGYDTVIRQDSSGNASYIETALQWNDVITIDANHIVGVFGLTLFGEGAYIPQDVEFTSLNPDVAEVVKDSANNVYNIIVKQKTGTTYIIAKDEQENIGIVKLNVIKDGEGSAMPQTITGDKHTVTLKADGTVWAWGNNDKRQVGNKSTISRVDEPVQVMKSDINPVTGVRVTSPLTNVIKIAVGGNHSLALTSDGKVYAWGYGAKGGLGNGASGITNMLNVAQPVYDTSYSPINKVNGYLGEETKIIDIAAAGDGDNNQYSFALDTKGNVYAWGYNENGVVYPQDKKAATQKYPKNISNTNVILKNSRKLVADKLGKSMHVLKADGQIITWGDNTSGVYGIGDAVSSTPSRAEITGKAIEVKAGTGNVAAITTDGNVLMWGDLTKGQTGDDGGVYRTPQVIDEFSMSSTGKMPITMDISEYAQVIYADGSLVSAGTFGPALGRGEDSSAVTGIGPVKAGRTAISGDIKNVIAVTNSISSDARSFVITDNGAVWGYGENETSLIGDGTVATAYEPTNVGTSYLILDQYLYSLAVEGEDVTPEQPKKSAFNVFKFAGLDTSGTDMVWKVYDGRSDIITIDEVTGTMHPVGAGTTYVVVSVKGDSLTVGTFKVEVRPGEGAVLTEGADHDSDALASIAYPQVAAGENTTFALKLDGTVWAWGSNEYGELGNGRIYGTAIYPEQIHFGEDNVKITKIAAAGNSVLALDENNHVWAWGRNNNGQLGLGNTDEKITTPSLVTIGQQTPVSDSDMDLAYLSNIVDIAIGGISADKTFALFLEKGGMVYGAGNNANSQISVSDELFFAEPVYIANNISQIAIGKSATSYMLRFSGSVYSQGKGTQGEYGNGLLEEEDSKNKSGVAALPSRALLIAGGAEGAMAVIYKIDSSNDFADGTGDLYAWGANRNGELNGNAGAAIITPELITSKDAGLLENITHIGGGDTIYVVDHDGKPYMGGLSSYGQTSSGSTSPSLRGYEGLTRADGIVINDDILSMTSSVNGYHSAYADINGDVWAFGNNSKGQTARQDVTQNVYNAELVGSDLIIKLDDTEILQKANDAPYNLAEHIKGYFGFNLYKENTTPVLSNTYKSLDENIATVDSDGMVTAVGTGETYIQITSSAEGAEKTMFIHVQALPSDELLDETEKYIAYPQIDAGDNFVIALRANGDMYAWGDNTYGQLGLGLGRLGSIDMKPQKITVTDSEGNAVKFRKISAGPDFAMAIDTNGNLYTWGRNLNGQLGNGEIADIADEKVVPSPTHVTHFTDYGVKMQDISAGGVAAKGFALALAKGGDVFAWGYNGNKQINSSSSENIAVPTYISVTGMTAVSAGKTNSYAVQELGYLFTWGDGNGVPTIQTANGKRSLDAEASDGAVFILTADSNTSAYDYEIAGTTNILPSDLANTVQISSGNATFMVQKDGTV
ncbi:MAG: RCC1-like domain-containing protein, partial [Hominilimicola sp.]